TDAERGGVHIIVDEAYAARVGELVMWTGTLLLLEVDHDFALTPRDPSSRLVAAHDEREHWYEGTRTDVLRAIETWPLDRDHRILAEPVWGSDRVAARWRTRVVKMSSALEIGDGALVGWGDGASLRIRATKGSAADGAIRDARARLTNPVLARGHVSLGSP